MSRSWITQLGASARPYGAGARRNVGTPWPAVGSAGLGAGVGVAAGGGSVGPDRVCDAPRSSVGAITRAAKAPNATAATITLRTIPNLTSTQRTTARDGFASRHTWGVSTAEERIAPQLETEALDEASAHEPGRTSMLAALGYRDFRLFWFGLVVSNIGTWMQQFGLGWLVVQLAIKDGVPHLAPFYLGLVGLSRAVPGLAFGLFGGAVADRADPRRPLLATPTSAAVVAAIPAALTISQHINILEIVLLSAMNSIIFPFDAPVRQAVVPRLVSQRELMSAIGLNSAAFNGATLVGPLLGGVLIIPFGVGGPMLLNAA